MAREGIVGRRAGGQGQENAAESRKTNMPENKVADEEELKNKKEEEEGAVDGGGGGSTWNCPGTAGATETGAPVVIGNGGRSEGTRWYDDQGLRLKESPDWLAALDGES